MCRSTKEAQDKSRTLSSSPSRPPLSLSNKLHSNCRRVGDVFTDRSPKPVKVSLSLGDVSSHLLMIPDTGADITVIGTNHLDALNIPRTSLSPPLMTDVQTTDGSSMPPAVGCFQVWDASRQHSALAISLASPPFKFTRASRLPSYLVVTART